MALFEKVHTLILRFANMEKLINSLNLSTPIFQTLQYSEITVDDEGVNCCYWQDKQYSVNDNVGLISTSSCSFVFLAIFERSFHGKHVHAT